MTDVWGSEPLSESATAADLRRQRLWVVRVDVLLDDTGGCAIAFGTPPDGGREMLWYLRPDASALEDSDAVSHRHAPHEQLGPLPQEWRDRVAAAGELRFVRRYELRVAVLTDSSGRGVRHPACTGLDDGWPCSIHDEHIVGSGVLLSMCRHRWGYQCRSATSAGLCTTPVPVPGRRCSRCVQ